MTLDEQFEKLLCDISLGERQHARIQSAVDALTSHLTGYFELSSDACFIQGSYANGTAVKPCSSQEDGEYDVDIVVLSALPGNTPNEAKTALKNALKASAAHCDKIVETQAATPCVRLQYADEEIGGFHVDVVPAKGIPNRADIIEVPRSPNWELSAPRAFTAWCKSRGEPFARTVKIVKRWRDEHQDVHDAVKSMILQVLIGSHTSGAASDAERFCETLESLSGFLLSCQTVPIISNPVLPSENLASRWEESQFQEFRSIVQEASAVARQALDESDPQKSNDLWQGLIGESFPNYNRAVAGSEQLSAELGPTAHVRSLSDQSFALAGDVAQLRLSASVKETFARERFSPSLRRKVADKPIVIRRDVTSRSVLRKGQEITFKTARPTEPGTELWWQVVNTGTEAASENDLRGLIFKGTDPKPFQQIENTKYAGVHWVECFLIKNARCVARSGRFYIKIAG